MTRQPHRIRPAFTLIEVMVVVVIAIILAALIFVAVGAGLRTSRRLTEQQFVRSLATGVEQFKQAFKFYPPLVNDADPIDTPGRRVRLLGDTGDGGLSIQQYMRDPAQPRFSILSLPVYLGGVLGRDIDGVEGLGFNTPSSDGVFSRAGPKTDAYVDTSRDPERLVKSGSETVSSYRDRWNTSIRYYRWEATKVVSGSNKGDVARNSAGDPLYNVPGAVGDATVNAQLRSGGFAIISAGPDQRISDFINGPENSDNIVEIGQ